MDLLWMFQLRSQVFSDKTGPLGIMQNREIVRQAQGGLHIEIKISY